jgi:hypothetical protein
MKLRSVLAFSSVALIAVACGGTSSLGSGDGNINAGGSAGDGGSGGDGGTAGDGGGSGSGGGGGYDSCANRPCGAPCTICPPDGSGNCAEDAVMKYCDQGGNCGPAYPVCDDPGQCTTSKDCAQIGAPCQVCPDGTYACPSVECVAGQCVGSFEGCGGQTCNSDADCPVSLAPCEQCPDGTVSCPEVHCENGACVGGFPGCSGYDPCGGLSCGDRCSLCPPDDPACAEDMSLKYCDENGVCGGSVPKCDGGAVCKADSDCPGVGACPPCPGGQCAELGCVNGQCEFTCPPNPNPECKADFDCPAIELCKYCPDGSCAETNCVNGECLLACR